MAARGSIIALLQIIKFYFEPTSLTIRLGQGFLYDRSVP
jgi:hypothetical protein